MSAREALDLPLTEAARAIRERKLSSVEVTRASLEALEACGGRYLAVAGLDAERALADAAACDAELVHGRSCGPLHGVPMAHKDMFYRKGRVCECGTAVRRGWVAEATATALERLDGAGAVDLGRLNMVEWALGLTGHNAITGTPRHPWNLDHITGGSSSGPVASVSARLTYASLGSDTGGSIRFPAACTNLGGIKPTYGRVSRANAMPLSPSLDHVGPLTRTVADSALLLQVLAGHDPLDATTSHRPVADYSAGLGRGLQGLRIAVPRQPDIDLDAEIEALLDGALGVLTAAGATAVAVDMPSFRPMNVWRRQVMQAEAAAIHRPMLAGQREAYNPTTLARLEPGLGIAAVDYLDALRWRGPMIDRVVAATLAQADLLLLPVMPTPVPRIDETEIDAHPDWVEMINRLGWYMGPINYLGLPALALPMGFTANGLPNAFQLVARPFDEATLFRAGAAYERETGFSRHAPPAQ